MLRGRGPPAACRLARGSRTAGLHSRLGPRVGFASPAPPTLSRSSDDRHGPPEWCLTLTRPTPEHGPRCQRGGSRVRPAALPPLEVFPLSWDGCRLPSPLSRRDPSTFSQPSRPRLAAAVVSACCGRGAAGAASAIERGRPWPPRAAGCDGFAEFMQERPPGTGSSPAGVVGADLRELSPETPSPSLGCPRGTRATPAARTVPILCLPSPSSTAAVAPQERRELFRDKPARLAAVRRVAEGIGREQESGGNQEVPKEGRPME